MTAAKQQSIKYVYDFAEGNRDLKDLLGGKGANLAEMTNIGLPVPPGFTITTEACKAFLADGKEPESLRAEVDAHLATLEAAMGRKLGDRDDPLLVSVRSGAKFSMPGMMETVLNVGLTDETVERSGEAGRRRRAVRLGLLPPADSDVRQDRVQRAGRGVRARARRREARQGRTQRSRSGRVRSPDARHRVQEDLQGLCAPRLPAGPARADGSGDRSGLRVVERRPRRALPQAGTDSGGPRHGREHRGDGLRQPRRRQRNGRRVHPRPGDR